IGEPNDGYEPAPSDNAMPAQEPGTKRARSLPYQPNANLDGFTFGSGGSVQANLSFSNAGSNVRKASHFSVYNNAAPDVNVADYPAKFPGQYTVAPTPGSWAKKVRGSVDIGAGSGDGRYDITVVGPNHFLRHFAGDVGSPGLTAQAQAAYSPHGFAGEPRLWLTLTNKSTETVTFTVAPNHYSADRPRSYRVRAHDSAMHVADPFADAHGWYDVTVTIGTDPSWSRRFVGHLEDGNNSVTG